MKINVVNKYKHVCGDNDYYIGRPSPLANIYSHMDLSHCIKCETRDKAVDQYEIYLKNKIQKKDVKTLNELNKIYLFLKEKREINLVCFCAPKRCHGEVIKKIIQERLKEADIIIY